MALTLQEVLAKAKAEREAREAKDRAAQQNNGAVAQPVEQASIRKTEGAGSNPASPAPPKPKSNSFFGRFSEPAMPSVQAEKPVASAIPAGVHENTVAPKVHAVLPQVPLPAYSEDETENLRKNLAFLAANLDEKEVIGQVLRTTVRQIQAHPELNAIMIDSDFDLIVAAARRSMKYTARRKEEKASAKEGKQAQKDELKKWLKDQGVDLEF